jgi:beta-xylosidase
MIRETLNADSKHAFVAVTPNNGIIFQTRSGTAGSSVNAMTITGLTAPYWVKLVQTGNSFAGYYSYNGSAWTQMGSAQTITMGSNKYIGMGVTSHTNGVLCSGTLNNLTATP